LKKLNNDAKMSKDDAKQVANDASKERQQKQGTNIDKKSLKMNSDDINTNNAKTMIGLKKNKGDPQIRKDNPKTVANNASKDLQKKVGKNVKTDPQLRKDNEKTVQNTTSKELQKNEGKISNKTSPKINNEDINNSEVISKTKQNTSQNDNVSILILIVKHYTEFKLTYFIILNHNIRLNQKAKRLHKSPTKTNLKRLKTKHLLNHQFIIYKRKNRTSSK
jgi:hypothetical protein